MWLERLSLCIALLGILVLGLSWFMFEEEWAVKEHPAFSDLSSSWYDISGTVAASRQFPWGTLLTIDVQAPVQVLAPPNVSLANNSVLHVIAKSVSTGEGRHLQAVKLVY